MQQSDATVSAWGALGDQTLTEFAGNFLSHVVKLLCMFVHIIEEREPEVREKVNLIIIVLQGHTYILVIF